MQMKRIMISHKTVVISFARRMCVVLLCTVLLAACSLYRKYDATPQVPENLMGNVVQDGDTACLGDVGWREIFTDTLLQKLIERAWVNNTDVQVAELTIAQAQNDSIDHVQFVVVYDFLTNTTDRNGNATKDSVQLGVVVGSHTAKCMEFNHAMCEDFGEWKDYGLGEFNARKYNLFVLYVGYPAKSKWKMPSASSAFRIMPGRPRNFHGP